MKAPTPRQTLPQYKFIGTDSTTALTIDHVVTFAIMEEYQGLVERPLISVTEGCNHMLLVPIHNLEAFSSRLHKNICDESQNTWEDQQTGTFCPGCGYLISSTTLVKEHLHTQGGRLMRTQQCYLFAAQTKRLATTLLLHPDHQDLQELLNGPALRLLQGSPQEFLRKAGNIAEWVSRHLSKDQGLHNCPWCTTTFAHSKDLSAHLRSHMARSRLAFKPHETSDLDRRHRYVAPGCFIRQLAPGSPSDMRAKTFRSLLRWANLYRRVHFFDAAMRFAVYKFWLLIFRKKPRSRELAVETHMLLSFSGFRQYTMRLNSLQSVCSLLMVR